MLTLISLLQLNHVFCWFKLVKNIQLVLSIMGVPTNLARAKQLALYWDNYINYLTTLDDRQPNIGQGRDRPLQVQLYVQPFGIDLATTQYLEVGGTAEKWTAFKAAFGAHTSDNVDLSGANTTLDIGTYRPAKVVIKTGLSTTKQVVTAKTTKRKYTTRGGISGAVAFGRKNGTELEIEAYEEIRASIKATTGFNAATTKISRIKEKV